MYAKGNVLTCLLGTQEGPGSFFSAVAFVTAGARGRTRRTVLCGIGGA